MRIFYLLLDWTFPRVRFRLVCTLVVMVVASSPIYAAGPNLCRKGEDSLFSCLLENKKFVAVCAPYDAAKNQDTAVVYRYGTPDHIELTLPEDSTQFRKVTHVDESVSNKAMEDDEYVRFTDLHFSYITYNAFGNGFDFSGLAVFDGQKLVSNKHCLSRDNDTGIELNFVLGIGVLPEVTADPWSFWRQILPSNSVVRRHKPTPGPDTWPHSSTTLPNSTFSKAVGSHR